MTSTLVIEQQRYRRQRSFESFNTFYKIHHIITQSTDSRYEMKVDSDSELAISSVRDRSFVNWVQIFFSFYVSHCLPDQLNDDK